ncbi:MAG: alpha/beta hydrolase [Rickettsiaceae bacterium]|nr:MAG: alpha/beta hydrolase [Rickettsiaceae bacterium]
MTNEIYYIKENRFIAYNLHKSNKKNMPYVIFLHGLMSDMEGTKARHIEQHSRNLNYNFIKFDNFGHGKSSGSFVDQTMSSWLAGLKIIIDQLTHGKLLIVGSSMGGWLALLAALEYQDRVQGVVCLAPAVDFTHNAIWQKLTTKQQIEIQNLGSLMVSNKKCELRYEISYQLIKDGQHHLLLQQKQIYIDCDIQIIHGLLDEEVESGLSIELMNKIKSNSIVLKLIKDGDHQLSRKDDLNIITNSIDEVITNIIAKQQI